MPIVGLPDGRQISFPDDMSNDAMESAIQKNFPEYAQPGIFSRAGSAIADAAKSIYHGATAPDANASGKSVLDTAAPAQDNTLALGAGPVAPEAIDQMRHAIDSATPEQRDALQLQQNAGGRLARGVVNQGQETLPVQESVAKIHNELTGTSELTAGDQDTYRQKAENYVRSLLGLAASNENRDEKASAQAWIMSEAKRSGVSIDDMRQAIGGMRPELDQFARSAVESGTLGLIKNTDELPASGLPQVAAKGLGSLAGFIVGPAKIGGALVGGAAGDILAATADDSFGVQLAKAVVGQAAVLGVASGLEAAGRTLDTTNAADAIKTQADAIASGEKMGAVFGAAGRIIPGNSLIAKAGRIVGINTGMDAISGSNPIDERPLEQKIFDYGLNTFFALHGAAPAGEGRAYPAYKGERPVGTIDWAAPGVPGAKPIDRTAADTVAPDVAKQTTAEGIPDVSQHLSGAPESRTIEQITAELQALKNSAIETATPEVRPDPAILDPAKTIDESIAAAGESIAKAPGEAPVETPPVAETTAMQIAMDKARVKARLTANPVQSTPLESQLPAANEVQPNPEQRSSVPVTESQVPVPEAGNVGVAPDQAAAVQESPRSIALQPSGKVAVIGYPEADVRAAAKDLGYQVIVGKTRGALFSKGADPAKIEAALNPVETPAVEVKTRVPVKHDTTTLWGAIKAMGGISSEYAQDITGETNPKSMKGYPVGIFRKGGASLDEVARALSQDYGFNVNLEDARDNGGVNQAKELIQQAASGSPIYSMERSELEQSKMQQLKDRSELLRLADEYGVSHKSGMEALHHDVTKAIEFEVGVAGKNYAQARADAIVRGIPESEITAIEDRVADTHGGGSNMDHDVLMYRDITNAIEDKINEIDERQREPSEGEGVEQPVPQAAAPERAAPDDAAERPTFDLQAHTRGDVAAKEARASDEVIAAREAADKLEGKQSIEPGEQGPLVSRDTGDEFWRKIKAGESFTDKELIDAYSIGRRGTTRTGQPIHPSGTYSGKEAARKTVIWRDGIGGFDGYRTSGEETAPGEFYVRVTPEELATKYPSGNDIIGYLFTKVGDGKYRLDLVDPKDNTPAFDALKQRDRLEQTGLFAEDGDPYYRVRLDKPYATSRVLLQEAVRRLALDIGRTPAIVVEGRETGARASSENAPREFRADTLETKYSSSTEPLANPHTPETFKSALGNAIGTKLAGGILKTGKVEIITADQIPDRIRESGLMSREERQADANNFERQVGLLEEKQDVGRIDAEQMYQNGYRIDPVTNDFYRSARPDDIRYSKDGRILAYFDSADGITRFVADNIPATATSAQVRGLAMHEIGVHALTLGRDSAEFQSILKQFETMNRLGNAKAREAFARAKDAGTSDANLTEEALGHAIEAHPDLPIVKRVIAWFRSAIRSVFGENALRLSTDDLTYMAQKALHRAPEMLGEQSAKGLPLFSKGRNENETRNSQEENQGMGEGDKLQASDTATDRGTKPEDSHLLFRAKDEEKRIPGYSLYEGVTLPEYKKGSITDSVAKALAPATRDAAMATAGIIRHNLGEQARNREVAHNQLLAFAKVVDKLPQQGKYNFIDAMEHGTKLADKDLNAGAEALRKVLDERRDQVIVLGNGQLENFNENYFPHIWQGPAKVSQLFTRRPLEGGKGFLKRRTYDYFKQGISWKVVTPDGSMRFFETEAEAKAAARTGDTIKKPLKPVTDNPVELALLKIREMDKYIYGQKIFQEMKNQGIAKFVRFGAQAPDGWFPINDKIAKVMQYSEADKGMIQRGQYYAPEPAATILSNHLSPGLHGIPVYDLIRGAGNFLNGVQLGFSAFHLGFTTLDAMISKGAIGFKQVSRGDILKGVGNIAQSVNPLQPLLNLYKGDKLFRAYMGNLNDPSLAPIVEAIKQAGGRVKMDDIYRNTTVNAFRQALRQGDYGRMLKTVLPTLMDRINKPIFEYLVPRQKLGVFFDMAKDALAQNPNMDLATKREVFGKLWDSVDNRMGQLVYDNVFWNHALKDALMVSTRSVGWNLGTFREIGGGVKDLAKIKQLGGLSDRTAYIFSLAFVTAVFGSITQYMLTGKGPEDLKDVFFPRTGKVRPDGTEDRLSLPSYMKDIAEYAHDIRGFVKYGDDPFNTLKNKMHPLISTVGQMLNNKDFFGGAIRSPGDTPTQQALDYANYLLKQFTPFSYRNYMQQAKVKGEDPSVSGYLSSPSMIGITPAPGYIVKNDEQAESAQVSKMRESLVTKFKEEMRDGADWSEIRQRARDAGITSQQDLAAIRRYAEQRPAKRMREFATH